MSEEFLFTKIVDMSTLFEGISIPVSFQSTLFSRIGFSLKRGEQRSIKIQIQGFDYDDAIIKNQWFDDTKYPGRRDIVQIRYAKNSLLAKKLCSIFSSSKAIVDSFLSTRTSTNQLLVIQEDLREYISLYADKGLIRFDCISRNIGISNIIEPDFVEDIPQKRDLVTSYFRRSASVVNMAKQRANGFCQLCGKKAPFLDKEGNPYLEAHHVIWLSRGGKDVLANVVALCSNCHSKMHVLDEEKDVSLLLQIASKE